MATYARTRYASRAVDGTSAYDLDRVRGYNGNPRSSAAPARAPEIRPVREPEPMPPLSRPRTTETTKSAPRTGRRAQKAYGISLFAIFGFMAVAALMVTVLLAQIKYDEVTNQTVKLQTQLTQLTEQERKLKIQYEDAFDVTHVENYATSVLGMSKPAGSQAGTVSSKAQDKAVVLNSEGSKADHSGGLATFLSSLIAYFK